jgi:ketosteroid isomerase-like protein
MKTRTIRLTLVTVALALGVASAALAGRVGSRLAPAGGVYGEVDPFGVAALLAEGAPDAVVVVLDATPLRHPMRGATAVSAFGPDDDAFVAGAPRARALVLAGGDPVRVDRVARRLRATGRDVRVLAGGLGAWDTAMDVDPKAPADGATADVWAAYRTRLALRRAFGDAAAAPAPVAAPVAPAAAPAGGAPKKREGC